MSHKLCVYVTNCVYLSRTVCHEPWVCVTYSGYIRTTCHEVWKCVTNCGYVSQTLDMPHELCTCVMNCEYVSRIICHELRIVDSYDIRNTKYGNESRTEDICHDNKPCTCVMNFRYGSRIICHELWRCVTNYTELYICVTIYKQKPRTFRVHSITCLKQNISRNTCHELCVTNCEDVSRTMHKPKARPIYFPTCWD